MQEDFEILGTVEEIEVIAVGPRIREFRRLKKIYGFGRWRKLKGVATVLFGDGTIRRVEVHWYEAHGIGRKKVKIKRYLDWYDVLRPLYRWWWLSGIIGGPEGLPACPGRSGWEAKHGSSDWWNRWRLSVFCAAVCSHSLVTWSGSCLICSFVW